ncbi:LacI family DNA-binding transcriptional regulator [Paraburkholderia phytofirmans]|uniref:Transcriptional regulator, LacI family n=1 Tax=Paraburkholderia phytofirmans (strain DSM 17436 / LMG 22146 / PsJN) TaxID=398527 RepID=B2T8S7_PARPJ|nr:LacI family DNA-binding transcriptional regulator [Paraburkholderia phytofirmans]ACD20740.1 transcriptional regulator, LacI family [Paraburkholderia phytofirmans PsJN]
MVNLKQVAALAGVSSSTVSRAIAAPERLHPETLQKVREAIASLDYVPFAPARVLRSGRTRTIGIVAPTLMNELYARAIDTLESEFLQLGYTGLLTCHRDNHDLELSIVRALIERGVDGLALIGSNHHHDVLSLIRRQKIPYVLMWAVDREHVHPTVGYDNHLAMGRVAEYLVSLGHVGFGVLPGPDDTGQLSNIRLSGIREGLGRQGIALRPQAIIATPYDPEAVRYATRKLLCQANPPTALICNNDFIAAAAIAECRALEISVPGQVSVTGFGDWDLARLGSPSLTTVRSDAVRIGHLSARNLLKQINADGDCMAEQDEFEAELIVRESTSNPSAT